MSSFFTIGGIDDDKYPPEHPDVIKFFDKPSADRMLKFLEDYGVLKGCHIAEHNVNILTHQVTT